VNTITDLADHADLPYTLLLVLHAAKQKQCFIPLQSGAENVRNASLSN